MKKILITGGAGYIGSVLVGVLLARGHGVRVVDRLMFGGESLLSFIGNKNFEIIAGDIRDGQILKQVFAGITDVIHLAALVGEPACKQNPKITREINVDATMQLATMAKSYPIEHFVFSSTCSNYGVSSPNEEATELSILNPLSLYAETKIAAEEYLLSLQDDHFHPTILRLATVFGLSPRMRFNLMINEFGREAALGKAIMVKNETAWRPFVHTSDASNAFTKIIETPLSSVSGQIFNVVGENIQKKELARLAQKFNSHIEVSIVNGQVDDKRDYRVSAKKIKDVLGWKHAMSVKDGFSEIFYAVQKGLFRDPYEFRYNAWFDESTVK